MGRFKTGDGQRLHSRQSNKQDTPLKAALPRRSKHKRLLPIKCYDALPEEPEVEEINVPNVNTSFHLLTSVSTPAKLKSEDQVWTSNLDSQMTEQEAFEGGGTDIRPQNLTLEDISSSSLKIDMSSDSDDDDDEEEENEEEEKEEDECYSSDSETNSSLPSPEIFREEKYVESFMLPINEDLTGFHFVVKNSTLLDLSHARNIHMHQPPNLSIITDASTIHAENTCEVSRRHAEESKVHVDSGTKTPKKETPQTHVMRRPITHKKKVWFRSPLFDNSNRKPTSATIINTTESLQPCCPHEQIKPDRDTSREGEISHGIMLTPGKAGKSGPEQVKVFDFVDKSAMDVMLEKMRERCARLKNFPLFPHTAAK